jgi:hypothetical protein
MGDVLAARPGEHGGAEQERTKPWTSHVSDGIPAENTALGRFRSNAAIPARSAGA